MDSSPLSDISMSDYSVASTVNNGHESYSTFKVKALALAEELFGDSGQVTVSQMHGGANNRVIDISINGQPKYILRIPRHPEVVSMDEEAAMFIFVRNNARIPCPRVVSWDGGDDNAIGLPYVIHARVQGDCLYPAWHDSVSIHEKHRIAKELGGLYRRMIETRNDVPGWPAFKGDDQTGPNAPVHIESFSLLAARPFVDRELVADREWSPTAPPAVSVPKFITLVFEAHQRALPDEISTSSCEEYVKVLGELKEMVTQMDSRGYFNNVGYSLYHNDIYPRNVMYSWSEENSLVLLDWDEVSFMPTFMASTPPTWVWEVDEDDDDDNEDHANLRRHAFETAAGTEYMTFAYAEEYDLLRELMSFVLRKTVCTVALQDKAYSILARWGDLQLDDAPTSSASTSG